MIKAAIQAVLGYFGNLLFGWLRDRRLRKEGAEKVKAKLNEETLNVVERSKAREDRARTDPDYMRRVRSRRKHPK